jgi:CRISPR-associated protein Csd1
MYVEKGHVVDDLVSEGVLPVAKSGCLLKQWESRENKPPLFKHLTKDTTTKEYKPQNALIRWVVETGLIPETWKDPSFRDAWINYSVSADAKHGLCMVTGINQALTDKHPKGMRGGKDGAKLISYKKEDESDFIYLGRFIEASQVLSVGSAVSQKAHSALRWLIERQGYKHGDQAIVAWATAGEPIPDWSNDTNALFLSAEEVKQAQEENYSSPTFDAGDVGQAFAQRLNNAIRGYRTHLGSANNIVVIGLDSASKGRMAITYYRELTGSEYLKRIENWHKDFAWPQNYGVDQKTKRPIRFIGAPAPKDIAEAAYGRPKDKQHEKLIKATVERLLPCVIDSQPLPRDLAKSTLRRCCNRFSFDRDKNGKQWEWEKCLGIACALFKGFFKEREYQMTLETNRATRDYLYGRLLALAENIERYALTTAENKRETNAERMMQRFADHPASTWRNLELALAPYKARLNTTDIGRGFLVKRMKWIDEVMCQFETDDFLKDGKLSGEFLLGYHCQRQTLNPPKTNNTNDNYETPTE